MWWFKTLLIGIMLWNSNPETEDWVHIRTKQNITFLFPSRGEQTKQDAGQLKAWIYRTGNADCIFSVVCTPATLSQGSLSGAQVQRIYNEMRDGSVDMPDTELKEEKRIPAEGMYIRQICYTVTSAEQEYTYYKRFIFRGNYIYQLTIGGKSANLPEWRPQIARFFDSVAFSNE